MSELKLSMSIKLLCCHADVNANAATVRCERRGTGDKTFESQLSLTMQRTI